MSSDLSDVGGIALYLADLVRGVLDAFEWSLDEITFEVKSSVSAPTLQLPVVIRDLSCLPSDSPIPVVFRMNYNYFQQGLVDGVNMGLYATVLKENGYVALDFLYQRDGDMKYAYRYGTNLEYKGLSPNLTAEGGIISSAALIITQSGLEIDECVFTEGARNGDPVCVVDFPLPDLFGLQFNLNENYRAALDAMNVGDKIAVMVNGVYILNELVDGGGDPLIRTSLVRCIPHADYSAMEISYERTGSNIVIYDSVSCLADIEGNLMEDYWSGLGVAPIRYDFEEVVRYIKYIDILPQYFSEI